MVIEYGDYECPYARRAFREIARLERRLDGELRFVFRHFPLTDMHPHALAAAAAAEAATGQGRFWEMHSLLFHRQQALEDDDLRSYSELGLDEGRFDEDRAGASVLERIRRDVESGLASGEVRGRRRSSSTDTSTVAPTTRPRRLVLQLGQLLAHALVARVLGEDALEVLARHGLFPLREIVLGPLGKSHVPDLGCA